MLNEEYLNKSQGLLNNQSLIEKEKNGFEEPFNLSGRQILGKTAIGLIIGGIIAAILFITLSFTGKLFTDAFQQVGEIIRVNPILPFLLLFIGFLGTFIGNIGVAGAYNLFFNKKYYDISKMFGSLLLTNGILFFILAPIYIVFSKQIDTLFLILGFHVFFSVFISANQIEYLSNPNYSASALMGNVLGFSLAMLIYSIIRKTSGIGSIQNKIYLLMLIPSVVGYTIIPFGSGIREKIYYQIYEMGNNPLYISSTKNSDRDDENKDENNEEDLPNIDLS
ncbi:hypothetical protein K9M48_02895 [Candidatus Gracilibacteria bacterium]|nr:hypothetical protein [Candidatus Gracilibacteria bacterium]